MDQKMIAKISFCICIILSLTLSSNGGSLTLCPGQATVLVSDRTFQEESSITNPIETIEFRVPDDGFLQDKISCILIIDKGSGGEPAIVSGGIDYNYVEIRLKSRPFGGLNYEVQVYLGNVTTVGEY